MFWWKRQSKVKKVFYAGAALSLAAGVSAGKTAVIPGVFLSLILLFLALLLPNKPTGKTPQEREWNLLITPRVSGKDKVFRTILSIISLIFIFVSVFLLFRSLAAENYAMGLIYGFVLVAALSSWVYLHPTIYNEFFSRTKIIPLLRKTDLKKLYEDVSTIKTPYGTPLMGIIPGVKEPVAVYRIIDLNWIVYFYVHNDEIIIDSQYLGTQEMNMQEVDWVLIFIQQLADMFAFIENTGRMPDDEEIARLFKMPKDKDRF